VLVAGVLLSGMLSWLLSCVIFTLLIPTGFEGAATLPLTAVEELSATAALGTV
jgi:hypothetical protein